MPGLQARFEPATVEVTSLQESAFTVTLPAGGAVKPFAIEVKGTAADGKTNSLCLQLGPTEGGRAGRHQHARAADEDAEEPRDHPRRVRAR